MAALVSAMDVAEPDQAQRLIFPLAYRFELLKPRGLTS